MLIKTFAGAPEKDVLSGHTVVVDAQGRQVNRFFSRRFSLTRFVYGASQLAQQSTFFRADAFRGAGGCNVNNRVAWDGELWVDLALSGATFGRINAFLSAFRIYGDTITGSGKFTEAYSRYAEDIFIKVKGRKRDGRDLLLRFANKGAEYILHPTILRQRLLNGPVVGRRSSS